MNQAVHWQKSTFSDGGDGNTCVELATASGTIHLRESDAPSIELVTTPTPLSHLLHGIRSGALGRV
ncbi:hypothetical protein FHS35_004150 [Streptomyces umbrinus]|jgi:hypothetical protein|uniref:DUF397 domain-containing protein n=1 Tax=Streptomyces phaeochromogenes group TaxID=2838332 RepID=UPI0016753871|nr:DUF397 domain-containing protein [Streptomyces umbrinus]MCR3727295.1 hypothetical protein [Streptomyces umbrinus]MCX4559339.1 DUF397 domain-containing protein [Streptomyces phaeochromogenes]GHB53741.1 hypothetical protein GCM10010306_054120 [Streptomyces umbrinus]GHH56478.1 hypothetical protein GCM10018775_62770 [Streptomyces umbrinus]